MKVAVDVCIGKRGIRMLREAGYDVVVEAEHGERDEDWFARALRKGVDVVISGDSDLSILSWDANVEFFRVRPGWNDRDTIGEFIHWYPIRRATTSP